MGTVAQPLYALPTTSSVKWLATQERNISRELPYPDIAAETPEEYVFRMYLQFLWLPQSIMPLHLLITSLLRVTPPLPPQSSSQSPPPHPLHAFLQPLLLTSRAASQKYRARIPQLLTDENEPTDSEEEYLWYAYHKDKLGDGDGGPPQDAQDEYESQERLKTAWLEKFERREVQIQILLHFLLISLAGDRPLPSASTAVHGAQAETPSLPPSLSPSKAKSQAKFKSKKRKRKEGRENASARELPPQALGERLEGYMDKLAMWQLMQSVDSSLARGGPAKPAHASATSNGVGKGKEKQKDDRDWMQAFCEDVVEPLFKRQLPELCALFRSKLFSTPDAGLSDTDTEPSSPKYAAKRLKSSASAADKNNNKESSKNKAAGKKESDLRTRSRSLSMSLEQEKRERSMSVGPNALRKRATMFEVTMTTKFGKASTAKRNLKKAELERTASQSQRVGTGAAAAADEDMHAKKSMGSVLVAATPKHRAELVRMQSQKTQARSQSQTRLPALFAGSASSRPTQAPGASSSRLSRVDSLRIDTDEEEEVEDADGFGSLNVATPTKARLGRQRTISHISDGEGEGEEWTIESSPDVLLLGGPETQEWLSSGEDGGGPPASSSSPGDVEEDHEFGGFGDTDLVSHANSTWDSPVRAGSRRGRVLVGDTPTKPR